MFSTLIAAGCYQAYAGPALERPMVSRVQDRQTLGDNGKLAENWSVNLLHPYEGNVSAIGDCFKLLGLDGSERKAVVVIGYEHSPPQLSVVTLLAAFEVSREYVSADQAWSGLRYRERLVTPVQRWYQAELWRRMLVPNYDNGFSFGPV